MLRIVSLGWCLVLAVVLSGCSPRGSSAVSVDQATQEHFFSPNDNDTPALERGQHLANLGVDRWHRDSHRGGNVTIAVLDSGFRNYRQFLGKGLPKNIKVRSFRRDRNLEARDSQHGILCGEVLHAIAPDANLIFVNWEPDSPQSFIDAVRWAKAEGAKIISCSLIMPSWSDGEGGGEVHRALEKIVGDGRSDGDLLFFASAGNTAQRHWCGVFAPNADGWHEWRPGVTDNVLVPWGKERVAVEFYGPTHSAFEVSICDHASGKEIGRCALQVDSTQRAGRAVVRFEPEDGKDYDVKVRCIDAPAGRAEAFHLVVLGGTLQHTTNRGSIPFPGDGASVCAIGAVGKDNQRVSYSSCGPNSRLPKPDYVAAVPFPSRCRERPFAGTSAAAPQAAGLAAVLWSDRPDNTANQIKLALRGSALDLGPRGHDHETGYGLIRLPQMK